MSHSTEVAIIGAGPYGLSLAAHLQGAAIPFRIFGSPMDSWRKLMPKGMLPKSDLHRIFLIQNPPSPLRIFARRKESNTTLRTYRFAWNRSPPTDSPSRDVLPLSWRKSWSHPLSARPVAFG